MRSVRESLSACAGSASIRVSAWVQEQEEEAADKYQRNCVWANVMVGGDDPSH